MTEGRRFSRLGIVLMVVFGVLSGAAVLYLATPDLPSKKQVLAGFFCLAGGAFVRDRKNYFLLLWVFIQTFGQIGFKFFIPHDQQLNLYYFFDIADVLLVGLYVVWFIERSFENHEMKPLPRDCLWTLAGLCLAICLSVINAADKTYSIYQAAAVVRGALVFIYLARHAQDPRTLWGIVIVLVISMFFQSSLGVIQEVKKGDIGAESFSIHGLNSVRKLKEIGSVFRVSGTYVSGNTFSCAYLDFMLPLVASVFFIRRRSPRIRLVLFAVYALGVTSLIFTLSRGGWLAFTVGWITFWITLGSARGDLKRFGREGLVIIVGFALVMLLAKNVIISRFMLDDQSWTMTFRVFMMQVSYRMIGSHPWLGVGVGNYLQVMHLYDATAIGVTRNFLFQVHNLFLCLAAESGLPALACYLAFVSLVLRRGWKVIKASASEQSLLAAGIFSGLVAGLFHGMFEPVLLGDYLMFWMMSGLLVAQERTGISDRTA